MRYLKFALAGLLAWGLSACTGLLPAELPASAIKTDRGTLITLSDILFEYNEAILRPDGWEMVSQVGLYLQEHPEIKVLVEGHTDAQGSQQYNLELSKRRADTVRNVLRARSVEASRIVVKYYGKERPIEANDTEEGRKKNRRVEITLLNAGAAEQAASEASEKP